MWEQRTAKNSSGYSAASSRHLLLLLLVITTFALFGCNSNSSNDPSASPSGNIPSSATDVTIDTQPVSQNMVEGGNADFTVVASNASDYQWQRSTDGGGTWSDIGGATAATLTLASVTLGEDGDSFRVVASNSSSTVTSSIAVLTVSPMAVAPAFTTQPSDAAVTAPATASFTVASSGTPTPTLQWQISTDGGATWSDIAGATSSTYTTPATSGGDDGNRYRAVASNTAGTVTSNEAVLTVQVPSAPAFTTQPADISVAEGSTAQFSVVASGVPTPALQWQISIDSGATWSDIAGATSATYTTAVTTVAGDNGHQYRAVATNASGAATSNAATLTVSLAGTVIFSVGNSLYAIKDDGSGQVALAGSNAYMGHTVNGKVIYQVTTSSLDIASVTLDGTTTYPLANSADPEAFKAVTPSGKVIYKRVTSLGGNDLYSVNDDGTGTTVLADSADNEDFSSLGFAPYNNLTWGPTANGRVVYVVAPTGGGARDVYSVKEDGTGTVPLGNTANDEWSPYNIPGGYVAYISNPFNSTPRNTVLIGEDGLNPVTLTTATGGVVGYESGRVVNFGYPNSATSALYSLLPDGNDVVTLDTGGGSVNQVEFNAVANGHVIYTKHLSGKLFAVPVSGGVIATLVDGTTGYAAFKAVTSNGKVVYSINTNNGDLTSVSMGAGNRTVLAGTADIETFAAVTTDGKVIYQRAPSGASGATDIYIVNDDGTNTVPLATSADTETYVGLSPTGRIIYQRNVSGTMKLYSVKPDGTGTVELSGGNTLFKDVF